MAMGRRRGAPGLPGAPGNHQPAAHCCWWILLAGFPYAGHHAGHTSIRTIHADASPADVTPIIYIIGDTALLCVFRRTMTSSSNSKKLITVDVVSDPKYGCHSLTCVPLISNPMPQQLILGVACGKKD